MWYRLVGVDLASQGNLTADVESSIRIFTGQAVVELAFGAFEQVVVPNASVTPGAAADCHCGRHHMEHFLTPERTDWVAGL